jgi:formylglycine-generating enzyme required for sulfatase activity
MGAPYGRNLLQWSRGEYQGANNPEDDLAIITTSARIPYIADDHGGTSASASQLFSGEAVTGLIETNSDADFFRVFIGAGPQPVSVDLPLGTMLDVELALFAEDGSPLGTFNSSDELEASTVLNFPTNRTVFIRVVGTGKPEILGTGYSAYSSLGAYTLTAGVPRIPQTITFIPIPDQFVTNVLTLSATGGASGNPVTFAVTNGPAVISGGNQLSFTGTGSVTITASQAGSLTHQAAPDVSRTFNVTKTPATITLTPSSLSQVYDGSPRAVAFTTNPAGLPVNATYNGSSTAPTNAGDYAVVATIDSPLYQGTAAGNLSISKFNATVTLSNLNQVYNGTPRPVSVATVPAGLPLSVTYNGLTAVPVAPGSYTVVATINEANHQGSATGTLQIAKLTQTINFTSIPDQVVTASPTLSATGGGSGQPVVFEVTSGPATLLSGNRLVFTGAGLVSVRATQAGNATYDPAPPVTHTFQVTRIRATLMLSNLSQVYSGVANPVGVTTNPAGLRYAILYGGDPVVPVEPGTYQVIAYVNEVNHEGDSVGSLVISKATQVILFHALPAATARQVVTLDATGGPSGNPVTFEVFSGPGVITGGNQLSFTAAGNVVVRARQAGNARYLDATPVDRTVVVSKAPATLALGNLSHTYDGTAKSPSATTDPPGLAVTYAYNGSTAPAVNAGDYAVLANIDDPRYQGSATATLAIAKAAQSIHFPQPAAPITTDTVILSASGGGSGNPITFAVTGGPGNLQGSNQLVFTGAGAVTVTASQSGNGNYLDAPAVPRTLTVTKAPVTSLRLTRLHQVFDGTPREVLAQTDPPGLTVTLSYAGSPAAPTGTGNYNLLAEIDDPIYEGSTTATLLVDDPGRMIAVSGGSLPAVGPVPAVEAATFLLGRYEVTWGVWRQVRDWAAGHGYDLAAVGTGCADDHPVRGVSWFDAVKWCNARTEWENVLLGRTLAPAYRISGSVYRSGEPANAAEVVCDPGTSGYRLPDHAERLYAARGGSASTGQPYPGGSDPLLLGWHAANANAAAAPCDLSGGRGTQPAGFLQSNELGFHDLAGNVAEWTGDSPEGIPAQRAQAGGDWDSPASALLLSAQSGSVPTGRSNRIGLRLARSVSAALAAALDGAGLEWDSGGTAPWFAQTGQSHDTLDAAAAGPLTGIEANWIETTANGPANLTFRWKSRLPAGSGALIVLRDGIEQSRIHGSTDWTAASVYLPAGSHVVRWRFERTQPSGPPPAAVNGENGAWLDDAALVPAVLPQVVTDPASGITDNSATGAGQVTDDGGSPVTARGLVLATSPAPVLETGLVFPAPAGGNGPFVSALAGLTPGTTYSLRAYATNEVGTAYGTERRLTTDEFVPLINGTATRTRIIASGDRQVFHFTLSGPREAVFATTGGAALRAELLDGSGRRIRSFEEDGDFSLGGALYPGNYSLHVFRGPDADGPQSFNLSVDATVAARSQPDVAAGPGLSSLVRADVVIFSQNASPVAAVTTVANTGRLPDRFRVSGTRGNQFFAVTYQSVGGGIITSTVVAGRHETALLALGDAAELVRIRVVPNRKLLRKTSGGRTVTLRRTHAMSIRATSVFDRVSSDSVSVSVRTR